MAKRQRPEEHPPTITIGVAYDGGKTLLHP